MLLKDHFINNGKITYKKGKSIKVKKIMETGINHSVLFKENGKDIVYAIFQSEWRKYLSEVKND